MQSAAPNHFSPAFQLPSRELMLQTNIERARVPSRPWSMLPCLRNMTAGNGASRYGTPPVRLKERVRSSGIANASAARCPPGCVYFTDCSDTPLRSATPRPPPYSSMNSTPADSSVTNRQRHQRWSMKFVFDNFSPSTRVYPQHNVLICQARRDKLILIFA